jgi:hypothetical protein
MESKMDKVILNTCGDGYWSNVAKDVTIVDMVLGNYISDELDFGELCVVFDTGTWDIRRDGLIYTDSQFLEELKSFLNEHGLAGDDVEYSEQGMQGDDYVSLDVGGKFLKTWSAKFGTNLAALAS